MNWPHMSEHRTDIETAAAESRIDFGQTLQLAREQAGISLEYVAEQINLPEKTVRAIENSDMSMLPPAAFVQGYIRAYAKIIDFDAEQLLRDFDAAVPHAHEAELHPLSSLPLETSSQTPLIRVVTGFVAIMAVLVLIYGAYSYYSRKSEDMEQTSAAEAARVQLPPEAPFGTERDARFENPALKLASNDESLPATEPVEEPAIADAGSDAGTETESQAPGLSMPAAVQTALPEQTAQQTDVTEPETAADAGRDVLVLESSAESWAEIRDATGERKFYGLLDQSRTRTLTGVAPFDIFLGNAPVVRVTLNDVKVDMTNHTRSNNIAHFKVSADGGRARFH
jgi:cytoskeleton protein RodZ